MADDMLIGKELIDKGMVILRDKMTETLDQKGRRPFIGVLEFLGAAEEEFHELVEAVGENDHDEVLDELVDLAILAVFESATQETYKDRVSATIDDEDLEGIYVFLEQDLLHYHPRCIYHSIHHILGDVSAAMTRYRLDVVHCQSEPKVHLSLATVCFQGILSVLSGKLEW